MGTMYLAQIVALHALTGKCGGSDERKVVRSLSDAAGHSPDLAQVLVDLSVIGGELIRRRCWCVN